MLVVAEPGAQIVVKDLSEKGHVFNQAEHPRQLASFLFRCVHWYFSSSRLLKLIRGGSDQEFSSSAYTALLGIWLRGDIRGSFPEVKGGSVCVVHQAALAMLFLVDFCCFLCVVSGAALGRGLGFAKSNLNIFVIASVWRGNRTGKTQLLSWCRSRSNKPVWGGKTINWWG